MNKHRMVLVVAVLLILMSGRSHPVDAATNSYRVPDNVEWVGTGIWVETGQGIYLSTHGLVITGPSDTSFSRSGEPDGQTWDLGCGPHQGSSAPCVLSAAPYGALVGRVGPQGTPFLINGMSIYASPASGNLYLALEDQVGFYNDRLNGFAVVWKE